MPPFLDDHPGYLGWTSRGLRVLHADWPTYPAEHGWRVALRSLGQFPKGSRLTLVSEIDRCFLLLYGDRSQTKDPFDATLVHVAIYSSDAAELHKRQLITGAYELSLAEWVRRLNDEAKDLYIRLPDGSYQPLRTMSVEDFSDDEDADESPVLMVDKGGLSITDGGWRELQALLVAERSKLHDSLRARAMPVVEIGQFDTAIREACVILESRLRWLIATNAFGQRLVDEFVAHVRRSGRFIAAQVKVLHVELRTTFKFVRNEFMHNLQELTATQCYAILARVSSMLNALDEVELVLNTKQ